MSYTKCETETDQTQTSFFLFVSLFVCNPIQPNVDDLAVLVFPQKPSSTLGVFLCPVLVTMCTGGSPGVAGTSGGSQRLPAGWTHTEKPVMLHGTTQSGVCRNVIVFAHNSVRVDLWHRSILSESACLDAPDIRRERPRHQYHQ